MDWEKTVKEHEEAMNWKIKLKYKIYEKCLTLLKIRELQIFFLLK